MIVLGNTPRDMVVQSWGLELMRRINFDTQVLRSFATIVDAGSFVAASERLNITQPAISQQIRKLEDVLGQQLFRRGARKLALTSAGEMLICYAREIIEINDEIAERVGVNAKKEIINIGMPEHFSESVLPALIAQVHQRMPGIQLVVKVARSGVLAEALTEGRMQIAMLLGEEGGWTESPLQKVSMRWLAGGQFDLRRAKNKLPLVLFRSPCDFRRIAIQKLEEIHLPWHCVLESEGLIALRAAVKASIGITALPVVRDDPDLSVLDEDGILPKLPTVAVRIKQHESWRSPVSRELKELIQEVWSSFGAN